MSEIKKYFDIQELVCKETFKKFGETAWKFFRPELLETILILRQDILKVEMTVNNAQFTQRGLRCNLCQLVHDKTDKALIYLSAHILGAAIDFDAKGYTAEQVRNIIVDNADLLPYPIRLEKDVTWVHLDVIDNGQNNKISFFTA